MAPSDNGKQGSRHDNSSNEAIRERLDKLGRDLDEVEKRRRPHQGETGARSGALGMAFRLGAEMVVGVVIGGVIGGVLDSWLSTAPAFLILFLLLGSGAGILNAVRSARRMQYDYRDGDKS
jgi:ATP synthase protein I